MELQYADEWVSSPLGRPLSLSLPFTVTNTALKGPAVASYFDNLLPDADTIRQRLAQNFATRSTQPFDLLAAVGRDCVGAIQLLPEGQEPGDMQRIVAEAVSDDHIERLLTEVTSSTPRSVRADEYDGMRISLAGAQEKTALLRWKGRWHIPRGTTPTSHILKLPIGLVGGARADFTTSVDNEWLCMRIVQAYGLPTAQVEIAQFGRQRVLVVERFDRQTSADGTWLMRLMQEDFCQALGLPPTSKYESDGGPGLLQLFATLRQSETAQEDCRTLMAAQILFWMLCAPDGHAKNFSLRILSKGRFRLTPLYDVMSALPVMGDAANQWSPRKVSLAMSLHGKNRHHKVHTIQRRHFNATAQRAGIGADVEAIIQDLVKRTPAVVAQVNTELPPGFSGRVAETVLRGLTDAADRLASMPAS